MKNYIPINKKLIPYTFQISLADENFSLTIGYNRIGDFFTVALAKDGREICAGEKVVYGKPLWENLYRPGDFPSVTIVPLAQKGGSTSAVTWDNFGDTVYLTVDSGGDSNAE